MNMFKKCILLGACVAALTAGSHQAMAQRNFDPAQMRQDRIDRIRDQMEIKDDKEWNAIEPLVGKVMDAERDLMGMRMGGMGFGGRGGRRNRGGDTNGPAPARAGANGGRSGGFFGEPAASMTALKTAIDDKATSADLKAKLAAVRAETKEKEAKLEAAQADLKGVLTSRQEAVAVYNGLLK